MSDAYVYYFTVWDAGAGAHVRSTRRATLECIKRRGEPLMESQIVVDQRELDDDGFLFTHVSNEPNGLDDLWAQIRSLKLRAESRDNEALTLDEATEGARKYMLFMESRELREQAQALTRQRVGLLAAQFGDAVGSRDFDSFGAQPTGGTA